MVARAQPPLPPSLTLSPSLSLFRVFISPHTCNADTRPGSVGYVCSGFLYVLVASQVELGRGLGWLGCVETMDDFG